MIGSEAEARLLDAYRGDCPPGWQVLGEGSYRRAYLSPTGVVYKRHLYDASWEDDNHLEHEISEAIHAAGDLPCVAERLAVCYVPKTSLYGSILAMEHCPGERCCLDDKWETDTVPCDVMDALADLGIQDTHGDNVLWQGDLGRYVCIDLGTSCSRQVEDLISGG